MERKTFLLFLFFSTLLSLVSYSSAAPTEYWESAGGLTISSAGQGNPYPWTINVFGFISTDTLYGIEVILYDLIHPSISELTIAISGPSGLTLNPPFRVLLGDVVYQPIVSPGVTLVFNSSAPRFVQNPSATLVSGTYAPTNFFCPDGWENSYPSPPPSMTGYVTPICPADGSAPYPTDGTAGVIEDFWRETVDGTAYNGDWHIWVYDNVNFPSVDGSISKWSINFKYLNIPPPSPTASVSPTRSVTPTRSRTLSRTPSPSRTGTAAVTATRTVSPTASHTVSVSPTQSSSGTPDPTQTPTRTRSKTASRTAAKTPTPTRTITPTPTASPPQCGDFIRQGNLTAGTGEQCDAGPNPSASTCCSKSCTFLSEGTVCGPPKESQCWSPRVCDGEGTCIPSVNEQPGTTCYDTYRHSVGNCTLSAGVNVCRTYKA
jgi:hypothetical protein